ncbi:MAG: hypothetical protein WCP21_03035 [Armatimonadota bacterium]
MSIRARMITKIEVPAEVSIEIEDTIRGEKVLRTVDFSRCLHELAALGTVDLHETDPAELITLATALAKHRAIDEYLLSIGVNPHEHLGEQ